MRKTAILRLAEHINALRQLIEPTKLLLFEVLSFIALVYEFVRLLFRTLIQ